MSNDQPASTLNEHQRGLIAQLRSLRLEDPPPPWRYVTFVHVGGLEAIGYGDASDFLLIVSSSGRSIIDCRTGEKIARDYTIGPKEWEAANWYHPLELQAQGIGLLTSQSISLAGGIYGGGLPTVTADYWCLELVAPEWPNSFLLLHAPIEFINGVPTPEIKIKVAPRLGDDIVVAYGFSPTGLSFAVAMSHGVDIFSRA